LTVKVVPYFGDDSLISRVVLEFIALLTQQPDTTRVILKNEVLIDYCIRKLMSPLI
jgi:hypothetical protein